MQRLTYLSIYLLVGGLGLLTVPDLVLQLLASNGDYGDVMPPVVGMFMMALGALIFEFVRRRDFRYYLFSVYARCSFIVVVLTALYFRSRDPLVFDAIVLVGLIPSIYVASRKQIEHTPGL